MRKSSFRQVTPMKTNQLAHLRSLVSLRCPHEELLRPGLQIMRKVKILMTARMIRLICFFALVHISGSLRLSNFCRKAVAKNQSQELTLTYIFISLMYQSPIHYKGYGRGIRVRVRVD